MTPWLLLVLFLPVTGEGLVTGWVQVYNTQAECQVARVEVLKRAGEDHTSVVTAQCLEQKPESRRPS
jgi:hypothetical protein